MARRCMVLVLVLSLGLHMAGAAWATSVSLMWTEEEAKFIREHPVIHLGVDPQFIPFEYIDTDGAYRGITADYLKLISSKTGLTFEVAPQLTWPQAYDKALNRELDMLPAISKTPEREQHFLFSEPYYQFKRVLVLRDTEKSISGILDLERETIAVQRNSSHHSYLLGFPKINLSLYDSVEVALTAVANGTEKAFLGNLATTNYLIRANGLSNLKFVAFEAEKQQSLYFAVRTDWAPLVTVLNKALATITMEQRMDISSKWIDLETETDYGPIVRVVAVLGAIAAVILGVSLYWIIKLRKEIEKRRQIQQDLETAKAEADEMNQIKSSFLARMSHEIRTPLNAITGLSYLLKKTEVTITQQMYLEKISQAATNMLSMINDILDFAKIESGKIELEQSSFNLDELIQEVVNIISYKIEEQKIGFRLYKDPQLPNWFVGDAKRLEQVLINLLNNAAKFTSEGEVSLDIRLSAREREQYHLVFTVKDSGIGMSEEQVHKLFEPFTQADSSITRRFGGSGLGLSIVKNLLDLMNGRVEVYSTEGVGSTFLVHLSLPVDQKKEEEYRRTLLDNQFRHIRVLVLEKTGANMNLIESYLRSFGMQCELTSTAESARNMLEAANGKFAKPFDLLIIDYDTPTEGAFTFMDSLRSNERIQLMPKVMMLLPMMREDLLDRLSQHAVDIGIGKPIIPSLLFNGILELFKLRAISAVSSKKEANSLAEPDSFWKDSLVLVVDDNDTNQLIAQSLLKMSGIQTISAKDGVEAVQLFRQKSKDIDVILMDLHMPNMDGFQATAEIRKISREVPIAAMTADAIAGVKEQCMDKGLAYFIGKPLQPEVFLQTVKDILQQSKPKKYRVEAVLDETMGMKSLGGNRHLFREVLSVFREENKDSVFSLKNALEEQRWNDAAQMMHKIKSSSGSIGARKLQNVAGALQKALEENISTELPRLQEEYTTIFEKLDEEILAILSQDLDSENSRGGAPCQ